MASNPNMTVSRVNESILFLDAKVRQRILDALRRLGLPE